MSGNVVMCFLMLLGDTYASHSTPKDSDPRVEDHCLRVYYTGPVTRMGLVTIFPPAGLVPLFCFEMVMELRLNLNS